MQDSIVVADDRTAGRGEYRCDEPVEREAYTDPDDAPEPRCWILRFHADRAERVEAELRETLGDVAYGDIYSMSGGVELQVRRETHLAANWSDGSPYQ